MVHMLYARYDQVQNMCIILWYIQQKIRYACNCDRSLPPIIVYAWLSLGHAKLQILMDSWSECKGEWRKSALFLKMTSRSSSSSFGSRRWLTRNQLVAKYNDQSMADAICNGKLGDEELKNTHTKPHPDAPQNEAGISVHSSIDISGPDLMLYTTLYWNEKIKCAHCSWFIYSIHGRTMDIY